MTKSIKTNPNSAKGPDKGKIVNKLYYIIDNTWVDLIIYFFLVSNLKPSIFSWKKIYIKNYDAILLSKYDLAEKKRLNYAYMLKDGVGRYNIFFSFLHKAWAAIIWYYGVRHGCQGFLFWKKKLSDNNNLFSKSLKNNIIVFQFFWKKMLSLPLCSTRVTRFF
jgi:hypothetical protein